MLREAARDELVKNMDLFYGLALDRAHSGYPTYTDEIKTRVDFEEAALRQDGRKTLLLLREEQVEGLIQFSFQPEDSYLQTEIVNISRDIPSAMEELEAYLTAHFPGYDCYLGFPSENTESIGYLIDRGWTCGERSYDNVIHLDQYVPGEEAAGIIQVTRENFREFARLHDQAVDEIAYWSSRRILEKLEEWTIWLYCPEGEAKAAIYHRGSEDMAEIFGVDYRENCYDRGAHEALLSWSAARCKEKGIPHMVYFEGDEGQRGALAAGFHCVGRYEMYFKKV